MENYNYNNDLNSTLSNIKDIIIYVIENHHKFVLLILVFVIIYFVDYITYLNTLVYGTISPLGATSPPGGLQGLKTPTHHLSHTIKSKGRRSRRRRH
jgi:hypothetical protein